MNSLVNSEQLEAKLCSAMLGASFSSIWVVSSKNVCLENGKFEP